MAPKTIILTGASRGKSNINPCLPVTDQSWHAGIGLAIANFLLEDAGKTNLVLLSRSKAELEKIQRRAPDRIRLLVGDLSDLSLGQTAVDLAVSTYGRLDGLVINHGTLGEVARIADCDLAGFAMTFEVNLFSAVAIVTPV